MPTQPLSAGVYLTTIDKSNILAAVATAFGGVLGFSKKGTIGETVIITNKDQFIQEFGQPEVGNPFHYTALAFLKWGKVLQCLRVVNGALYGGLEIKLFGSVESNSAIASGVSDPRGRTFLTDGCLFVYAKDPGAWNNTINVKITNVDDTNKFFDVIVGYPNSDGTVTTVEEFKQCSRQYKVDGFGVQSYIEEKIANSKYIRVLDNTAVAATVSPKAQATWLQMAQGSDGAVISDSELIAGWDLFANRDTLAVNLLMNGGYTTPAVQNKMLSIAETRDDCFCIFDMPYSADTVQEMLTYITSTWNPNSSYGAIYAPYIKDYDQYSDRTIPLPPSGYMAAQYAYSDQVAYPWYSPTGPNRGRLAVSGVVVKLDQGSRDLLCPARINPIASLEGQGIMAYWDETLQSNKSALSYVPIVRTLLTIKSVIRLGLRSSLFEPNLSSTRLMVENIIDEYLRGVRARGGVEDYLVVCNESNNPPSQRETGVLIADVYIKPTYSIRAIQVNIVVTKLSADFTVITNGVQF